MEQCKMHEMQYNEADCMGKLCKNEISVNNNYTVIQRKWEIIKQSNARTLAHLQSCTLVTSNRLKCPSNVQLFLNVTLTN